MSCLSHCLVCFRRTSLRTDKIPDNAQRTGQPQQALLQSNDNAGIAGRPIPDCNLPRPTHLPPTQPPCPPTACPPLAQPGKCWRGTDKIHMIPNLHQQIPCLSPRPRPVFRSAMMVLTQRSPHSPADTDSPIPMCARGGALSVPYTPNFLHLAALGILRRAGRASISRRSCNRHRHRSRSRCSDRSSRGWGQGRVCCDSLLMFEEAAGRSR